MVYSSFSPIRRLRISSLPLAISKTQLSPFFITGMGKGSPHCRSPGSCRCLVERAGSFRHRLLESARASAGRNRISREDQLFCAGTEDRQHFFVIVAFCRCNNRLTAFSAEEKSLAAPPPRMRDSGDAKDRNEYRGEDYANFSPKNIFVLCFEISFLPPQMRYEVEGRVSRNSTRHLTLFTCGLRRCDRRRQIFHPRRCDLHHPARSSTATATTAALPRWLALRAELPPRSIP